MKRKISETAPRTELAGQGKRYLTITFGCQANEFDTEVLAGMLESAGYRAATGPDEADLIVINTCAVRRKPEEKVAGLLGRLKAVSYTHLVVDQEIIK